MGLELTNETTDSSATAPVVHEETLLATRLQARVATVVILGQGYVGLPLAMDFATAGFQVVGIDVDVDRVVAIGMGASHSPDVSSEVLQRALQSGRYRVTTDLDALTTADAVIICVPTPLRKSKDPDISFLVAAAESVAARMMPGQLVVLESTTYPGTTEELLLPMLERDGLRVGRDFYLAFSPERLDPGNPHHRLRDTTKLVGGVTPACTRMAALLYGQIVRRVFEVSGPTVAELAKLHENTFRGVNIALVNELAVICHHLGVSVWEVIEAAGTKPFGFMTFFPGPGIGGHCIPVDPLYLSWKVRLRGYEAKFIGLADEMNRSMPRFVLDLLAEALNDAGRAVRDARVLVLGVAYKRGVSDCRESPALAVMKLLAERGAKLSYSDPYVPEVREEGLDLKSQAPRDVVAGCDCVVILTDHGDFDYAHVATAARSVVDARNAMRGVPGDHIIRL